MLPRGERVHYGLIVTNTVGQNDVLGCGNSIALSYRGIIPCKNSMLSHGGEITQDNPILGSFFETIICNNLVTLTVLC